MQMIFDNPDYSYFGMGVGVFQSYNAHNFTLLGIGADARFVSQKFLVKSNFRFHLLEEVANQEEAEPLQIPVFVQQNSQDFSIDAFYALKENYVTAIKMVYAATGEEAPYLYDIKYTRAKRTGVGIGYKPMFTNYLFVDKQLTAKRIVDDKIVTLEGTTSSLFSQHILRLFFSKTATLDFDMGFSNKRGDFANYPVGAFNHFYAGLLLGFGQRIEHVVNPVYAYNDDGTFDFDDFIFAQYDIQNNLNLLPLGFAVGYEWFKIKQGPFLNTAFTLEGGLLPGPIDFIQNNFYLDIGFSIRLGNKLNSITYPYSTE
jgi:hypothetical protein